MMNAIIVNLYLWKHHVNLLQSFRSVSSELHHVTVSDVFFSYLTICASIYRYNLNLLGNLVKDYIHLINTRSSWATMKLLSHHSIAGFCYCLHYVFFCQKLKIMSKILCNSFKMAAISKLSPQCYGVTVIVNY